MMRKIWRLWAKSIGEKVGGSDEESDQIACIRTVIVLIYTYKPFYNRKCRTSLVII
jgi:hypothetical protein